MRIILLALAISCIIIPVNAQNSDGWVVYSTSGDVSVSYKQTDCVTNDAPSQVAYIIKIENYSNRSVQVQWDLAVWYNNEKLSHDIADGENHVSIEIGANKEVVGDCQTPSGALYIFKDFITYVNPTKLTRFELENLSIINL